MALLLAIDQKAAIKILPYRYENQSEGWVLCHFVFQKDEQEILNTTGAFLQVTDIKEVIKGMRDISSGVVNEFELKPIEPNFKFQVSRAENESIRVLTAVIEKISYEEGMIKKGTVNQGNSIVILIDKQSACSFAEQLSLELDNIKPEAYFP